MARGSEGGSYHDLTPANEGGAYRSDADDFYGGVKFSNQVVVGYTQTGEWLEYYLDVPADGPYSFEYDVANVEVTDSVAVTVDGAPANRGMLTLSLTKRKTRPMRGLPSTKEALVLEVLASHGDCYGLELVARSGGALKRGTVYVTLARLEDEGLVRALRDPAASAHAGLPRPRYRLTAQGERALRAFSLVRDELRAARSPA